ncbi:hypothetical protein EZV62_011022 [Acer yangbiense]|uniref:Uncharacterized protein n=1 Tax=Acer yangbiense TaxID=1000413 RepID=A0A5C7I4V5_9ROSI|nr:hypothetical protein EZV62_011022 [Acer yangbiense]
MLPDDHCYFYVFCVVTDSYKWTLAMLGVLTSAVCYICAFKLGNIKEKPLYMAIFLTFISFLILFVTELLIDHRVNVAKLSQSPISFLISTFVVWLLLR